MNDLDDRLLAARSRLDAALHADPGSPSAVAHRSRRRRGAASVGATLVVVSLAIGLWNMRSIDHDETTVLADDPSATDATADDDLPPSTTALGPNVQVRPYQLHPGMSARTSADGRSVLISFGGAAPLVEGDHCTANYRGQVVVETDVEVRFALEAVVPVAAEGTACLAGPGYQRQVELALATPLDGRRLVEIGSGRELVPVDGSR